MKTYCQLDGSELIKNTEKKAPGTIVNFWKNDSDKGFFIDESREQSDFVVRHSYIGYYD